MKDFTKSEKVQVARNINKNLTKEITALKTAINTGKYTEATAEYSKVMSNCISCHTIIRGW